MPLVPLDIPAGVYRNGTEYDSKGRWYDTNLVRWREGRLEPIGGWQKFDETAIDGAARGILSWRANDSAKYIAIGTHTTLYASQGGSMYDITPTGYTEGREDSVAGLGYGISVYNDSDYGTSRNTALITSATTWSLDNWGEYLVACASSDGVVYEWQLSLTTPAAVVANAPVDNVAIVVTNERHLVCLGAGGNKRKVQWSDQEDNTEWTPSADNLAGDLTLERSGRIRTARRVGNDILIWTDVDCHLMRYLGPPYVYGIERIGNACGIIGPNAAVDADNAVYWMGYEQFYAYTGRVQGLPCTVREYVFDDINRTQADKIYGSSNRGDGEIIWFYPSSNSTENDRYVVYNYQQNLWYYGELSRTAWLDRDNEPNPVAAFTDGYLYLHEDGLDDGTTTPASAINAYIESSDIEIEDGNNFIFCREVVPDLSFNGSIATEPSADFTIEGRKEPGASYIDEPVKEANATKVTPTENYTQNLYVRVRGRGVRLRVASDTTGVFWRLGSPRLRIRPDGRR